MKRYVTYVALAAALILAGCKNDVDAFNDTAAGYARSGGKIDAAELQKLKAEIAAFRGAREFKRFYDADTVSDAKLQAFLERQGYTVEARQPDHRGDRVNLYLENSGSMFGYVAGDTAYKDALTELLVQLGGVYGKKNIRLFFINTKTYPISFAGDAAQYPGTLAPAAMKAVGNVTHSEINDIFRQVIAATPDHTVSILVSDCIYSVSGADTANKLEIQKSLTKDVFQGSGMSLLLVKLNSAFNGTYYSKNNVKTRLSGQSRPFYFSAIGKAGTLDHFYRSIRFPDFKNYEHHTLLSASGNARTPYHTLVQTPSSTGFHPMHDYSDRGAIRGMEDIASDDRNGKPFTFSIAADLSGIPVEKTILTDPRSYRILKGGYVLTGIEPYNPTLLKPTSLNRIAKSGRKPTHLFHFKAVSPAYTDLAFGLKDEVPGWVYASSTNDDTDVKRLGAKTFGFRYLVEGIREAQHQNAPAFYFRINIKINR
jgi:hypothetical protein